MDNDLQKVVKEVVDEAVINAVNNNIDIDDMVEDISDNESVSSKKVTNSLKPQDIAINVDDKPVKNYEKLQNKNFIDASLEMEDYPKKLGYKTVKDIIYTTFFSKEEYYSSVFDIISSYIKAQKVLYLEGRSHALFYLNCLMLPAIFLSSLASVLSLAIETSEYGGVILASVNAFNSFLLAVINYSKLDAASEAHKISAHQYDKLQSMCEFTSGKILLLPGSIEEKTEETEFAEDPKDKLNLIEKKIIEIKETNTFILPSEVIKRFPETYHTNIFSKIKEFFKNETVLINNIKDLLNELRPLEYQVRVLKNRDRYTIDQIEFLRKEISIKTDQLIKNSNENKMIEQTFLNEIKKVNKMSRCYRICC